MLPGAPREAPVLDVELIRASRMNSSGYLFIIARPSDFLYLDHTPGVETATHHHPGESRSPKMAETSQQSRPSPEVQEISDTNMDMDIDDNAADGQERTIDLPTNKRVDLSS
jgi:hypothetical protein